MPLSPKKSVLDHLSDHALSTEFKVYIRVVARETFLASPDDIFNPIELCFSFRVIFVLHGKIQNKINLSINVNVTHYASTSEGMVYHPV